MTNYYLANLSVADCLISVSCVPVQVRLTNKNGAISRLKEGKQQGKAKGSRKKSSSNSGPTTKKGEWMGVKGSGETFVCCFPKFVFLLFISIRGKK